MDKENVLDCDDLGEALREGRRCGVLAATGFYSRRATSNFNRSRCPIRCRWGVRSWKPRALSRGPATAYSHLAVG